MRSIEGSQSRIFALMKLDDETFVNEAYALLLGRHPDSEGFMYYIERLHSGISKRKIILQLLKAPEAAVRKEADLDFSREVDEWQKKTASIKDILKSIPNIFGKKEYSSKSERNMNKLIGQISIIATSQARMSDEISALRATILNGVDTKPQHCADHQMSRQARHIYASLLRPAPDPKPDAEILCE